jgi:hypothetical protein
MSMLTKKKTLDSRFSSKTNDEAKYLNELVEQFREIKPQILNLSDVILEII